MRPFELMFDHFEVSQKQNNGQNRDKLRQMFVKRLSLELIEALFIYMTDLVKDIRDITS